MFSVTGHLYKEFTAQKPVTRSFDVFFICAGINGGVNSGEAGDARRHRAHYDVIVMGTYIVTVIFSPNSYY